MKCDVCDEKVTICRKCEEPFEIGDELNCDGFDGHICKNCIGSEGNVE